MKPGRIDTDTHFLPRAGVSRPVSVGQPQNRDFWHGGGTHMIPHGTNGEGQRPSLLVGRIGKRFQVRQNPWM